MKFGVIGCGLIAEEMYLPHLVSKFSRRDLFLVDLDQSRLDYLNDSFGEMNTSNDYKEIVDEVDCVIICTPPSTHFEISSFFLENNINIICEKPVTNNYNEYLNLKETIKTSSSIFSVSNTRRYFPTNKLIKYLISSKKFGEVRNLKYYETGKLSWNSSLQLRCSCVWQRLNLWPFQKTRRKATTKNSGLFQYRPVGAKFAGAIHTGNK